MAKKTVKTAAAPTAKTRAGGGALQMAMLALGGLAIVPVSLPTLALLVFGLLPSMAAAVVERGPQRYAWLCVGGLNFAGLAPYLLELWTQGHTLDHALTQLSEVVVLLLAYGAAACGWLLYMAVPPVVGAFMQVAAQRRSQSLRGLQARLVERWGPDVAGPNGAGPNKDAG